MNRDELPKNRWLAPFEELARAYAAIGFLPSPKIGLLFAAATFVYPNTALAGLLGGGMGLLVARLLGLGTTPQERGWIAFNALLVGLALGAYYTLDLHLLPLLAAGSIMAVLLTETLHVVLGRLLGLPVLSLPFVFTTLPLYFAVQGFGNIGFYPALLVPREPLFPPLIDSFFTHLGAALFAPHPVAGLLIFLGLLIASRWLALLAISGFAAGALFQVAMTGFLPSMPGSWVGFNDMFTAMAVGGVFVVPGLRAWILAVAAAMVTSLVAASLTSILAISGLPILALPFNLVALTLLLTLAQRPHPVAPYLILQRPDLPEVSRRRASLAQARLGAIESLPLRPPFLGQWSIYQGFDGPHTHRGLWRHALDFIVLGDDGKSYEGEGGKVEDYHCYGLPVVAPAAGTVVQIRDHLPDTPPGDLGEKDSWGNVVVLQVSPYRYVVLAHLMPGSIKVKIGDRVELGETIARCGASGRAPQPHLHLQVQSEPTLGAPTLPFHLTALIDETGHYRLHAIPPQGGSVTPVEPSPALAPLLHPPVGTQWRFAWEDDQGGSGEEVLTLNATLLGELRLASDGGGSVGVNLEHGVTTLFDPIGVHTPVLAILMQAAGITPHADEAGMAWSDAPDPSWLFLPLIGRGREILFDLGWPNPVEVDLSRESTRDGWRQTATLRLRQMGLPDVVQEADATFVRGQLGPDTVRGTFRGWVVTARQTGRQQIADVGIPGGSDETK